MKHDEEGMQQYLDRHSKKSILWISSRGLKYTEDSLDGPRVFIMKAHVVRYLVYFSVARSRFVSLIFLGLCFLLLALLRK
jgi:hypothetical protein